jgi:hypothetical protein
MKHFLFTLLLWPFAVLVAALAPFLVLLRPGVFDPLDRLICAASGGCGTISAWAWTNRRALWARVIISVADKLDSPGHCQRAYERENPTLTGA